MTLRRLSVHSARAGRPSLVLDRQALQAEKLVYVLAAKKPQKYPWGRSRILYIGTTSQGVARLASSAASRAHDALGIHGVKELYVYFYTCSSRKRVRTWLELERGLLLTFRERYGNVPVLNNHGRNMHWRNERIYFSTQRLATIVQAYED